MSYDLSLYLKRLPEFSAERFSEVCKQFGISAELCPDFTIDGSLSPLCAKLSGMTESDPRAFLALVEYNRSQTEAIETFTLSAPKRKWWQLKRQKGETIDIPAGSEALSFSCGIDSLELPFALLIAYTLADEESVLIDPQLDRESVAVGASAIADRLTKALDQLRATPTDRLLLHEFDEWI